MPRPRAGAHSQRTVPAKCLLVGIRLASGLRGLRRWLWLWLRLKQGSRRVHRKEGAMDDQGCPRCKTTKYRNPSLKLMVNVCGHTLWVGGEWDLWGEDAQGGSSRKSREMLDLGSGEKRASLVSTLRRKMGKGNVVSVNRLAASPEPLWPGLDCRFPDVVTSSLSGFTLLRWWKPRLYLQAVLSAGFQTSRWLKAWGSECLISRKMFLLKRAKVLWK